jgi:hypothetical protein
VSALLLLLLLLLLPLPPIMAQPPPSFWRWWLQTVHSHPSQRMLQAPTTITAAFTSTSSILLSPTAALPADAFNLIAVALLVLLLCRGLGALWCVASVCMGVGSIGRLVWLYGWLIRWGVCVHACVHIPFGLWRLGESHLHAH